MRLRQFALPICALFLCANDYPSPPEALVPYIEDGEFDPGDFGYLKGMFAGASEQERAQFQEILAWSQNCNQPARNAAINALAARGFSIEAGATFGVAGPAICLQPAFVPIIPPEITFEEFNRELARVRPIYETYLLAIRVAESTTPEPNAFGRALEERTLAEQMGRQATNWGNGITTGAPELTPVGRAILRARLGMETAWHDRANTQWLKEMVAQHGWPKLSEVSGLASHNAWLLAQHADADPVFQLDALRLMEPLVSLGEVSGPNYAYLYDRVMLKLTGRQRYATQFECVNGERVPQSLEDAGQVARYRQEAGLAPLEEYMLQIRENYGDCG